MGVYIPANHNVNGTCGACGGPLISPMFWAAGPDCAPTEFCTNCGKQAKPIIPLAYGPLRKMK